MTSFVLNREGTERLLGQADENIFDQKAAAWVAREVRLLFKQNSLITSVDVTFTDIPGEGQILELRSLPRGSVTTLRGDQPEMFVFE